MGTVNVLEAIRITPSVKAAVFVTSDKCYANKETMRCYKEDDIMGGIDPYSSSKGCAEIIINAYQHSFFNPDKYGKTHNVALASVRAGNVIGGGDWAEDRLIPDCIRSLVDKKTIIIRSPQSIRPWQFVLEPLSGYLQLGNRLLQKNGIKYAQGWNFGPEKKDIITVENVVKKTINIFGEGKYEVHSNKKYHEAKLLRLDISLAKSKLAWKPKYNVDKSLEKTIEWYKEFYSGKQDMFAYSIKQIEEFQ
jgi:CDP-glucose 4,6-dehydratase